MRKDIFSRAKKRTSFYLLDSDKDIFLKIILRMLKPDNFKQLHIKLLCCSHTSLLGRSLCIVLLLGYRMLVSDFEGMRTHKEKFKGCQRKYLDIANSIFYLPNAQNIPLDTLKRTSSSQDQRTSHQNNPKQQHKLCFHSQAHLHKDPTVPNKPPHNFDLYFGQRDHYLWNTLFNIFLLYYQRRNQHHIVGHMFYYL